MARRRVRLKATEDAPEQYGWTIGPVENGVQLVCIDPKYRDENDPDGLVEVPPEQLEEV